MYGYIRQGRRTALARETIGGVPFWVLTAVSFAGYRL